MVVPHPRSRRTGRPRLGRGLAAALVAGAAFHAGSLGPWRQLVDAGYALSFAAFTGALVLVVTPVAALAGRRSLPASFLAAAAVFLGVWAWNRRGPIDVVLLHLDSFRADASSTWGYERVTTPNLDAFARERGVVLTRFIAQSAGTDKSTPAMLAGIYPSMFYDPWSDGTNFLVPDRFPLLGQYLALHGYRAVGLSSNPEISAQRNYARGFDRWEEAWKGQPRPVELFRRLEEMLAEDRGPCFAFGLILDPHLPYTPSEAFDRFSAPDAPPASEIAARVRAGEPIERFVGASRDAYDGEILETDAALGGFLDWLAAEGRLDRTMLIVTSDHGEKFLEYGEVGHGGTLFEQVLHVPMVWQFPSPLRFPRLEPAARRFDGLACHVDLVPTILGFFGWTADRPFVLGEDLIPMIYGRADPPERWILSEELTDGVAHRSLRGDGLKAFLKDFAGGEHVEALLELGPDGERRLPPEEADRMAELAAEIERRVGELRTFYAEKPAEGEVDPETMKILEGLGYTR